MTDRYLPPGIPGDDAATAPPESLMGGRYHVEREIGRGAAGLVYLALDTRLRRNVAIKELRSSHGERGTNSYGAYLERFEREARAGSVVVHQNVIAVHELAIDANGNYYLIMEYVDGRSLRRLLDQVGTLPAERAAQIALEVAKALEVVHERNIVHRDVKPANIMLTSRGVTKLGDFGIAQVGDESQRAQSIAGHPGTPLYMSPEQHTEMGYLDARSDLYSLGAVLYEMLAGEPYARSRRPLASARPDLSPQLIAIVECLMMPDPDQRYRDAGEVVTALENLAHTRRDAPVADAPVLPIVASDTSSEQRSGAPVANASLDVPHAMVEGKVGVAPLPLGPAEPVPMPEREVSPHKEHAKGIPRWIWAAIGGTVAVAAIVLIAVIAFSRQVPNQTPASTTAGGIVSAPTASAPSATPVSTPARAVVSSPTTSATVAGSPVPENAYVVADARNLITYAYPKDWKVGGAMDPDTDVVIGFTNLTPFALATIAKEDILPSTTLDAYTDEYIARRFRKSPDLTPGPVNRQSTQLAGQDARIIDFLQPEPAGSNLAPKGGTIYNYYILTLHDGRAWTVSYATALDQKDTVQPMFAVLARTFAFCPATGCTRQQTAPTVAPGQTAQGTDAAKQLTVAYPADWFFYPPERLQGFALRLSSPDGVSFVVTIDDQRGTLDEELKLWFDRQDTGTVFKFTRAPAIDAQIGGEPGKSVSYTYLWRSDPSAKSLNGVFWIVNHGGKQYLFEAAAIKARRADIEKIVSSVTFTAATSVAATPGGTRPALPASPAAPTRAPTPAGAYTADFSTWPTDAGPGQIRRRYDTASQEYRVAGPGSTYEPAVQNVADFTVEVDARQIAGPENIVYGLSFRVQPLNPGDRTSARLNFLINSQGYYRLDLVKTDGISTTLVDYALGPPGAFKTGNGAVNHLSVTCKGERITLAVNGTTLTTVTTTLTQPGNVGLTVFAPLSVTDAEVAFKRLSYTAI